MEMVKIGELYRKEKTRYDEGTRLNITNNGLFLEIYFNKPTEDEIKSLTSDAPYKIGLFKKDGILFFLAKFGNLNWLDAPYSIGLSKYIDSINLNELKSGQGYALNVALIDASTGKLVHYRLIGLQNRFSQILKKEFDKQKELGAVDRMEYTNTLNKIYRAYSTNNMVKDALVSYNSK